VRRVSVVGNSASGKTTLAAQIADRLGAPHLELDSIFHQPGWQPLPTEEFRGKVAGFVAGPTWVVDGNYGRVRDLVWERADTVVWLDLPRYRVMRRVIWRTLRRVISRAELWNGNREPWTNLFRADPMESIIAWAWTRHRFYRDRYASAQADPANAHLRFVRVRTRRDTVALLDSLARRPDPRPDAADQLSGAADQPPVAAHGPAEKTHASAERTLGQKTPAPAENTHDSAEKTPQPARKTPESPGEGNQPAGGVPRE
jgi:adenylate kinase family enzyme